MIKNETGWVLPNYMADAESELCQQAHIHPSKLTLIIKKRNRYISKRWLTKGNRNIPSGAYKMDFKTIIVRIGKKTLMADFRFVLAHELGHLKQHLRAGILITAGDYRKKYRQPESYANKFALLTCNCYPKSEYRISRIK